MCGAAHGDETFLLFDAPIYSELFTSFFDLEMSRLLVKTMADFANARKPVKFNNLLWPSVKPGEPLKVMELQLGDPKVSKDPFEKGLKFWKDLNLPRE
ncbi:unnamed protein product [Allacma fusca]|uniref:Carboxylesterase type B domain-containing protein n=1 Tax=Allacma fusca TaxID=39272 RepID=A0A8J2L6A4_9HEXA|nr:unnamed protein product [Allacma fusca]